MPPLVTEWGQGGASYQLWPARIKAIRNLETSLAANKLKALLQMATGSGKTFTAISFIYRLIKFGEEFIVQTLEVQRGVIAEMDRRLSVLRQAQVEVEANLQRAQALWQATLARAFSAEG